MMTSFLGTTLAETANGRTVSLKELGDIPNRHY